MTEVGKNQFTELSCLPKVHDMNLIESYGIFEMERRRPQASESSKHGIELIFNAIK